MAPAKLQSLLQSGLAQHRAGRLAEAEQFYRQARVTAPGNFDVLQLSGLVAYQAGRIQDAIEWLGRAHRLERKNAVCEMRYALALLAAKRTAEAEKHLRHAVETKADLHEGWDNLAYCLKLQNRLDEAIACHRKALGVKPDFAVGWYNYGLTLTLAGRVLQALECHERSLASDPNYSMARFGRAQALQQAHRIAEAVEEYGRFLKLQPSHHDARSYRLFALHYLDGVTREQMFAEHVAYGRTLAAAPAVEFENAADPQRQLRVAVLSPDLRMHSCAYFIEPLLQHLDPCAFELYLYHDHISEDAVSERLRRLAKVWRNFVGQPGPAVEKAIRADAPDILIDLCGHTGMTSRLPLFARRLAPVQISYLGYPDTTGVAAMDYRFTDGVADPVGEANRFATEKLVRFAPTAWTYSPPPLDVPVALPPCLTRGYVTFGCFNNLAKLTDRMLETWSRLLQAVPNSRLLLKGRGLSDQGVHERYLERLAHVGIAAERLQMAERTASVADHLKLYADVDIALDTFPYHGTTTTCEALWMGRPVVTLSGNSHMSRVGHSLLTALGRQELIAATADDYVRLASELALDQPRLARMTAGLRDELRASGIMNHSGQAAHFAAALRQCWSSWCATAGMPSKAVA